MKAACIVVASLVGVAQALDVKLSGINYNPRKGADWEAYEARCKSADEVRADMKLLASITSNIRLYSMTDCNQMEIVVPAAKAAGLTIWAGMWIGKDGAGFESEKAKLASLIEKKIIDSSVIGLHVGSETVYRQDLTAKQAIAYMQDVKKLIVEAGLKFPVTIADIGDSYMWYPELAAAVDIISINQFPFWEGRQVDGAIQFMADRVAPLVKLAKENNKQIMVGETGWATAGKAKAAGEASPENAAAWLNDFHVYASEQKWPYYYFTSFDTPWKHNSADPNSEAEVENHFGLFDATRTLKPCYANLNVKKRVVIVKDDNTKPTTTPLNVKPKTDTLLNTTTASTSPVSTAKPGSPTTTSSSSASTGTATSAPKTTSSSSSSSTTSVPSTAAGTATSSAVSSFSTLLSMTVLVSALATLVV